MKTKSIGTVRNSRIKAKAGAAIQGPADHATNIARARAFAQATKEDFTTALAKATFSSPIDDTGVLAGKAYRR